MSTTTTPKHPTLYQIHEDIAAVEAMIEESGGEMTEEAEAAIRTWFDECKDKLADKADAYAQLIRVLELKAAIVKEETERLMRLYTTRKNGADNLKARLKGVLEMHGMKKLESQRFKFSICTNGGMVGLNLPEPNTLPEEFRVVRIEANEVAIRNAIAAGNTPAGVTVKERGTHLRIT